MEKIEMKLERYWEKNSFKDFELVIYALVLRKVTGNRLKYKKHRSGGACYAEREVSAKLATAITFTQ